MKKFIFDALLASINVGTLAYDIYKIVEKLIEAEFSFAAIYVLLALCQSYFVGYFWGCADADLEKMFPNNNKNPRVA